MKKKDLGPPLAWQNRCLLPWKRLTAIAFPSRNDVINLPNQQRTLNKLPTELRRRNFVDEHRLSMQNWCPNMQKRACTVHVLQLSFHFCIPPLLVGKKEGKFMTREKRHFSPRPPPKDTVMYLGGRDREVVQSHPLKCGNWDTIKFPHFSYWGISSHPKQGHKFLQK